MLRAGGKGNNAACGNKAHTHALYSLSLSLAGVCFINDSSSLIIHAWLAGQQTLNIAANQSPSQRCMAADRANFQSCMIEVSSYNNKLSH